MMGKSCVAHFVLTAVLSVFACDSAFAFKYRTYTLPEQVAEADRIIVGVVASSNSVPRVSIQEYLKGTGGKEADIKYDCRSERDRPVFRIGEQVVLFLRKGKDGASELLGYGGQSIWPKKEGRWPFSGAHVCTMQEVVSVARKVIEIENEGNSDLRMVKLRQMIKSRSAFERVVALECLDLKDNEGVMALMKEDVAAMVVTDSNPYATALGASITNKIEQLKNH